VSLDVERLRALGITPWTLRPRRGEEPKRTGDTIAGDATGPAQPEETTSPRELARRQARAIAGGVRDETAAAPTVPESSPSPDAWVLQDVEAPVATVIVTWPDRSLHLADDHPAGALLARILAALEQPIDRFRVIGWVHGEACPTASREPVFCFADVCPNPAWVELPSLERLVHGGREVKAPAWAILKRWISRLAEGAAP